MPWSEAMIRAKTAHEPVEGEGRILPYAEAVREALTLAMDLDKNVFVVGQGVDDPKGMFGASVGLAEKFGADRCFDSPLSEEGMMGICTGAAMAGMRPVFMHNRPDFLLLTFNQLVNHAAKYHWMDVGTTKVPLVVWSAIGRGWGGGAQHSQAIQGLLLSVPGLKIVMPSTPHDAKGLMLAAIADNNPVLIFEHRWLMKRKGAVPEGIYKVPLGKGVYRRRGKDLTVVGTSQILDLAIQAADKLKAKDGIEAEVIDLRTLKPMDEEIILESVKKTGKVLALDTGWAMGGACAEIGCLVAEKGFGYLRAPVKRIGLPDGHSPAGYSLEMAFYPDAERIEGAMRELHGA